MKQILKSVLMILVVLICATSLTFAGISNQTRTRTKDRSKNCRSSQVTTLDGKFMLAGNGHGGSGDNGDNGDGTGDGTGPGSGTGETGNGATNGNDGTCPN